MTLAALGFRAHSGWAVLIEVGGTAKAIDLVDRRRLELVSGTTPRQPYHAAEDKPLPQAEKLIRDCTAEAKMLAQQTVSNVLKQSEKRGYQVTAAGIVSASARPLPDLATILSSHPLLHTAEGELYRTVLSQACERHDLPIIRIKEQALYSTASTQLGISAEKIQSRLSEIGRAAGPPWRQDEKLATLIAWVALASSMTGSRGFMKAAEIKS
jgi:hypothetical protein